MNQKNIKELAENYGIAIEEAMRLGGITIQTIDGMKKIIKEIWESIKRYIEALEIEILSGDRQTWPVIRNMTKPSQVLFNKPKFIVRKVIK